MPYTHFNHLKITAIHATVPNNCINIDDQLELYHNDAKLLARNKKILGLGTRYVIDDRTDFSDLIFDAATKLIENHQIDKSKIEGIIVVSTSHDYKYPATACIMQGKLDLSENCLAFDISGIACSAYVNALFTAQSLISSGAIKNCLVLCGDTVSKHSDKRNLNSNMLFGDCGSATFLEYTDDDLRSVFYTGTRGKDWKKIVAPAGGSALPIDKDIIDNEYVDSRGNVWHLQDEIMKGMGVFEFATDVGPKGIGKILDTEKLTIDDIDYFAFHQANKQIVNSIAGFAKIPKDKYSTDTFSTYGNTGCSSIVNDICHNKCNIQGQNKVMLSSFGVGLSFGFALIDFSKSKIDETSFFVTPEDNLTRDEKIKFWVDYFLNGK